MSKYFYHIILFIAFILLAICSFSQTKVDTSKTNFEFKGQLSSWAHVNGSNPYPLYLGARYIPQANYKIRLKKNHLIDFEASANIVGDMGVHFWDSTDFNGNISPYRLWGRYSSSQFEFRVGLQKIDFGTAVMMRALRWFDQVDPRDPLQLTDGVYGALARYYFLNNANIWLWGLYGNENTKGMEILETNIDIPEFGGRVQFPIPLGEAGLSYHHRVVDSRKYSKFIPSYEKVPENRIGIDAKWDLLIGLWIEGSYVNKSKDLGALTHQEIMTIGADYTFNVGAGLNVTIEHMLFASDKKAFEFVSTQNNTGLSLMYPIGMFDNIQAIFYYDWKSEQVYNFVNWFRNFDKTTFYIMAYWNPDNLITPTGASNLYAGKGIQFMFVYNH